MVVPVHSAIVPAGTVRRYCGKIAKTPKPCPKKRQRTITTTTDNHAALWLLQWCIFGSSTSGREKSATINNTRQKKEAAKSCPQTVALEDLVGRPCSLSRDDAMESIIAKVMELQDRRAPAFLSLRNSSGMQNRVSEYAQHAIQAGILTSSCKGGLIESTRRKKPAL